MTGTAKWRSRVVERSLARAAASQRDRRSAESVARRALKPATRMVEAALELAGEHGSASFTVQDVLARADASLQTFYRHFSGKDELLLAVIEEDVRTECDAFRQKALAFDDPVERLEWVVKASLLGQRTNRHSMMIVREHLRLMDGYAAEVRAADEPFRSLTREMIEAAQSTGRFPGVDAAEEAELIMALVVSRFHLATLGVVERSMEAEAEHIWRFTLAALARHEGSPDGRARGARRRAADATAREASPVR